MLPAVRTDQEWKAVVGDEQVIRPAAEDLAGRLGLAGAGLRRYPEGSRPRPSPPRTPSPRPGSAPPEPATVHPASPGRHQPGLKHVTLKRLECQARNLELIR